MVFGVGGLFRGRSGHSDGRVDFDCSVSGGLAGADGRVTPRIYNAVLLGRKARASGDGWSGLSPAGAYIDVARGGHVRSGPGYDTRPLTAAQSDTRSRCPLLRIRRGRRSGRLDSLR